MNDARVLDELVAASRELFTLPPVALKVLELTGHADVDSFQLKHCIEHDPALTAKVLRVVNSTRFGRSRRFADLGEAVTRLGIMPLKLLVLGFSLPTKRLQGISEKVLGEYWRRSLTKAVAARRLCERVWSLPPDEGFTLGLITDLGMLAFAQALGDKYLQLVDRVQGQGRPLDLAERHALGIDQRQFTLRLIDAWRLPTTWTEAIQANVRTAAGTLPIDSPREFPPLAYVLRQADLLTELWCGERPAALHDLLASAHARLNEADVRELAAELGEQVQSWAEMLQIKLSAAPDYDAILAEAQQRLVPVGVEAARALLNAASRSTDEESAELDHDEQTLAEVDELRDELSRRLGHSIEGDAIFTNSAISREADELAQSQLLLMSPATGRQFLCDRLEAILQRARDERHGVTLIVLQPNAAKDRGFRRNEPATGDASTRAHEFYELLEQSEHLMVPLTERRLALVLGDCDRSQGAEFARGLSHYLGSSRSGAKLLPLAIGAATVSTVPRHFDLERFITAAERCCSASQVAGGSVLKSIEVL